MSSAQDVRRQYEAYPYPQRDPADERHRLVETETGNLDAINHHLFGGNLDPARPFRVLVAGGGTGDATVYIAQQLASAGRSGEVVQVDISAASLAVAEARVRARGLTNVRLLQASLLDLGRLGLGRFDLVNCIGVLHHLDDPAAGMAAVAGALTEAGGLSLMLYAPYGRSGIYEIQAMLRQVAPPELPAAERLAIARRLLATLPAGNLFRREPAVAYPDDDAELFDLFLHARDEPFTVARTAGLLAAGGLRLAGLVPDSFYRPENWVRDPVLLDRVLRLPTLARHTFVEAYCGQIDRHLLYAVRAGNPVRPPEPDDGALVPVLGFGPPERTDTPAGSRFAVVTRLGRAMLPAVPEFDAILPAIDGRRSIDEIRAVCGLPADRFDAAFPSLARHLGGLHRLFLVRHPALRTP